MPLRVHELASELEVDATDLIVQLEGLNISVRNHMSRVADADMERVYALYSQLKNPRAMEWARARESEESAIRKKSEEQERLIGEALARATALRAQAEAQRKTVKAVVERQKVVDLKKASEEKAPAGGEAAPKPAEAAKPSEAPKRPSVAPAPVARKRGEEEAGARPLARAARRGRPGQRGRGEEEEEAPLADLTALPTIEVMKLTPDTAKRGRRRDRKKGGKAVLGEGEEDVAQVGKKRPRARPSRPAPGATGRHPIAGAKPRFLIVKKPAPRRPETPAVPAVKKITVHGAITVSQLAEKMRLDAADIIKRAMDLGSPLTLNDLVDPDLVALLSMERGFEVEMLPDTDESDIETHMAGRRVPARYVDRPPVVTIMGHVDHGKTSLLEQIAKLEVLDSEFGGITQHIGAYHVKTERGDVVFLDTPGHAAFTAMRMRGAQATDIVALVVAANDGVMPQTVEAINHAKAAKAPIVVAINKIDLPEADSMKVKQQLMAHQLVPEDLGGETLFCEISAKKGVGIDHLVETLLLQAEVMELKADPNGMADGVVIEAMRDQQRGIEATILVKQGTLRCGDVILAGQTFGRIRSMLDHLGRPVQEARPSFPARVYGLAGEPPEAGEPFLVMPDEREARQVAQIRAHRRRMAGLSKHAHVSLEGLADYLKGESLKELRVVLKGDVQGSIEAIEQSFEKIPREKVNVRVLHSAVGAVNESDVRLAAASDAVIIGFNVRPDAAAESEAQREGIEIKTYNIIYDLLNQVESAMLGLLDVKYREEPQGKASVLDTFKVSKVGTVAGCRVAEGEIRMNAHARLVRDGSVVHNGKIVSLRRVKDAVERVQVGVECGVGLGSFNDIKTGDVIETYTLVELERSLE